MQRKGKQKHKERRKGSTDKNIKGRQGIPLVALHIEYIYVSHVMTDAVLSAQLLDFGICDCRFLRLVVYGE